MRDDHHHVNEVPHKTSARSGGRNHGMRSDVDADADLPPIRPRTVSPPSDRERPDRRPRRRSKSKSRERAAKPNRDRKARGPRARSRSQQRRRGAEARQASRRDGDDDDGGPDAEEEAADPPRTRRAPSRRANRRGGAGGHRPRGGSVDAQRDPKPRKKSLTTTVYYDKSAPPQSVSALPPVDQMSPPRPAGCSRQHQPGLHDDGRWSTGGAEDAARRRRAGRPPKGSPKRTAEEKVRDGADSGSDDEDPPPDVGSDDGAGPGEDSPIPMFVGERNGRNRFALADLADPPPPAPAGGRDRADSDDLAGASSSLSTFGRSSASLASIQLRGMSGRRVCAGMASSSATLGSASGRPGEPQRRSMPEHLVVDFGGGTSASARGGWAAHRQKRSSAGAPPKGSDAAGEDADDASSRASSHDSEKSWGSAPSRAAASLRKLAGRSRFGSALREEEAVPLDVGRGSVHSAAPPRRSLVDLSQEQEQHERKSSFTNIIPALSSLMRMPSLTDEVEQTINTMAQQAEKRVEKKRLMVAGKSVVASSTAEIHEYGWDDNGNLGYEGAESGTGHRIDSSGHYVEHADDYSSDDDDDTTVFGPDRQRSKMFKDEGFVCVDGFITLANEVRAPPSVVAPPPSIVRKNSFESIKSISHLLGGQKT